MTNSRRLPWLMLLAVGCATSSAPGSEAAEPEGLQRIRDDASHEAPQHEPSSDDVAMAPVEDMTDAPVTPAAPEGSAEPSVGQGGADVLSVVVTGEAGAYTFAVRLRSPDTGCDRYADYWEVLSPDGALIYRRILAHSHVDEQPFTRSGGPVAVERGDALVVRGHMRPGGHGGVAMTGSVGAGFEAATLPAGFASDAAASGPQPGNCAF